MGALLIRLGAVLATAGAFALYARIALPWAWLGWIALVPWLAALERERSMRAAVASGLVMAMAFTVGVFAWFAIATSDYAGIPAIGAGLLLILAAPLLQPQFVVFAAVRHGLRRRGASRAVVGWVAALAWITTEWACPRLLGDTLGHGLLPIGTLRQGADVAGVAGLTLVLLLVNQWLWDALFLWRRAEPRRALGAACGAVLLVLVLASYGGMRLRQLHHEGASGGMPLTAALVQASLGSYDDLRAGHGTFEATRHIIDTHARLASQALAGAGIDLLVWPETVYPTTFGNPKSAAGAELDDELRSFVRRTGVPLLFGTYDRDAAGEYNAAVLLPRAPREATHGVYRKQRLFPLTEHVPSWLERMGVRRWLPWLGTWRAGAGPSVLTLDLPRGAVALAPLICLDAVDPGLAHAAARRHAEVIVTLSNDGWFADTRGARLHLAVAAFRSIETRLPQLRATNSGVSAIIDSDGEILAESAVGDATALIGAVRPADPGLTLAVRWGSWLGPVGLVVAPLLALLGPRRRRVV